jgi:ubiquitin-protein ligase
MDDNEIRRKRSRLSVEAITNRIDQDITTAIWTASPVQMLDQSESACALRDYRATMKTSCAACRSEIVNLDIFVRTTGAALAYDSESRPLDPLSGDIKCVNCSQLTCIGCGELSTAMEDGLSNGKLEVSWHCNKGRLACIWLLLCSFDRQLRRCKLNDSATSRAKQATQKAGSSKLPSGTGYGGFDDHIARESQPSLNTHNKTRPDPRNCLLVATTTALQPLLQSPKTENQPASWPVQDPPNILIHMLRRSSLLDIIAETFQMSSIEELTGRSKIYTAIVVIAMILNRKSSTCALILSERTVNRTSQDLFDVSAGEPVPENEENYITNCSVAASAHDLFNLCEMTVNLRAKAEQVPEAETQDDAEAETLAKDDKLMMRICSCVLTLRSEIEAVTEKLRAARVRDATQNQIREQRNWQKELAMREVDDADLLLIHAFAKEASGLSSSLPARTRRLIKDITCLKTSLPEGIYVRHGSSRLDIMKILITGPQDTPYANGLFEFDLFCSGDYPKSPPKMLFRTTGKGCVRFNPNLYNNGKVCLSLLGTWPGPGWNDKSTLLQVLVSIQAFIFVPEPLCNEPDMESWYGKRVSKTYSRLFYPLTIKHAMLEWLDDSPAPEAQSIAKPGLWQEVVALHFDTFKSAITVNVSLWLEDICRHLTVKALEKATETKEVGAELQAMDLASSLKNSAAVSLNEAGLFHDLQVVLGKMETAMGGRLKGTDPEMAEIFEGDFDELEELSNELAEHPEVSASSMGDGLLLHDDEQEWNNETPVHPALPAPSIAGQPLVDIDEQAWSAMAAHSPLSASAMVEKLLATPDAEV